MPHAEMSRVAEDRSWSANVSEKAMGKILLASCWMAALYGTLRIADIPTAQWDHSICGPWGCGPPLSALVACHGFWIVLLAPLVLWAAWRWPLRFVRRLGAALAIGGVAGIAMIALGEAVLWLPDVTAAQQRYFLQRVLFRIATTVDFPCVEVMISGVILILASRLRTESTEVLSGDHRVEEVEPSPNI